MALLRLRREDRGAPARAAENRTQLARDAFTYLHVVLVAGIIVAAVGDELVIAHPTERLSGAEPAAVVAGPALYLFGHVLLRLRMTGTVGGRRLAGMFACVAVAPVGSWRLPSSPPRSSSVVFAAIAAERVAAARRTARGEPTPLERLEARQS